MINAVFRRYGLIAYWFLFAALTLYQAQFRGFVPDPEHAPYPWLSVFWIWVVLAVLIGVLYLILRPKTFQYQWARILAAVIYASILVLLAFVTFVTDMPGHYYVPAEFSFVTLIAVIAPALVGSAFALWRWIKHAA